MKVLNSLKGDQCDHFYSIFKKMPPKKPAQDFKPSKEKGSTPSTEVSPKNDKNSSSGQIQGPNDVSPPAPVKKDPKPSSSVLLEGLNEVSPPAPAKKYPKPSSSELFQGPNEVSPPDEGLKRPGKGLNEGKEGPTSEKGKKSLSHLLHGNTSTHKSTHAHTASNKGTKGSGKQKLAGQDK